MTESYSQLEGLWNAAGGNPDKAALAAAIAEAESGGRAAVTSSNPDGGTNVGLWQLDTPGGKGAGYSVAQLQNPATNAAVAVKGSSDGADWSAWQTYAQGTYEQYLNPSARPAAGSSSGSSPATSSSNPFGNIQWWNPLSYANAPGDAVIAAEQFAVHFGAIAVGIVAGAVLVVLGVKRATGLHTPSPIADAQKAAPAIAAAAA